MLDVILMCGLNQLDADEIRKFTNCLIGYIGPGKYVQGPGSQHIFW